MLMKRIRKNKKFINSIKLRVNQVKDIDKKNALLSDIKYAENMIIDD